MELLSFVNYVVGVVTYTFATLSFLVLAVFYWTRRETLWFWLCLGWSLISLLQQIGLVIIQTNTVSLPIWMVSRVVWFVVSMIAVSAAARVARTFLCEWRSDNV